jgi:hypothetical protein
MLLEKVNVVDVYLVFVKYITLCVMGNVVKMFDSTCSSICIRNVHDVLLYDIRMEFGEIAIDIPKHLCLIGSKDHGYINTI